jgi:hypothetical protein
MPSPFPGMDPYLESPEIWPDFHHGLIEDIQGALNPRLRPKYVARVELRVYISDDDDPGREALIPDVRVELAPPRRGNGRSKNPQALAIVEPLIVPVLLDEEIKEARLEIRNLESNSLVTIIEVLSPTNKIRGSRGRASFMAKKQEVMNSEVNWVEIDLLRGGVPSVTHPPLVPSDYRVLVSRVGQRNKARYWPIGVQQTLPVVGIPLSRGDADVPLDLGQVFNSIYERKAYDLSLDYLQPPVPPLRAEDATWAKKLLREQGYSK